MEIQMSNPFKVGDIVKPAPGEARILKRWFPDPNVGRVVEHSSANYVGFNKDDPEEGWLHSRFVKVDDTPAKDPANSAFLQARQRAWDAYADSRRKQGLVVLTTGPRQQGFTEGFTQGYAHATADLKARYNGAMTVAAARGTDPATSHAAARTVKASKIADQIVADLHINGNASAATISKRIGVPLNAVTPRFAPLKRQGRVIVVGGEQGEGAAKRSVYAAV